MIKSSISSIIFIFRCQLWGIIANLTFIITHLEVLYDWFHFFQDHSCDIKKYENATIFEIRNFLCLIKHTKNLVIVKSSKETMIIFSFIILFLINPE
ncbi:hypothetical protein PL9214290879 [Planktothrix tepida PCC 9214]|uniref:Uncharacterized protein n=1 Tax=Planktothrix tepida PCC 9214 TaxID=671072 RepID=A0A1J1LFR0_9CYAN|nr:hypothetical protein PL9214290879 [Planktothrix tepida PCC 9214]